MTGRLPLFISLFICLSSARAETLKPFSEIKDAPGGISVAYFERIAAADCDTSKTPWKKAVVYVYFDQADIEDCAMVKKGRVFYDSSGNELGKTLEPITFYRDCVSKGSRLMMQLIGYVHQNNIIDTSVVEFQLEKLISKLKSNASLHEMKPHLVKFHYQKLPGDDLLTAYAYRESRAVTLKPGLRILMVFYDNMLVAVLYSRKMTVKNFEVQLDRGNYRLVYLRKTKEDIKERINRYYLSGT